MNKTININLAGIIFHLDEEAYAKLTTYLKSIKSRFSGDSGRDEILSDIEARIAEIFAEKLSSSKEVISALDVEEVITVMGNPEDYDLGDEDETEAEQAESFSKAGSMNFGRKLYRNPDEKIIGGVCSGLGAYFGVDPTWIRIAWLILFLTGGFGLLAYIILWIAMPEAKTTTQKLQMRGAPINISNIEKSVKDEFKNVSDHVSKFAKNPRFGKSISNTVDEFLQVLLSIVKFVFLLVFKLLGIALLGAGVFLLLTFVGGLFGHEIFINDNMFGWYDLSTYIDHLLVSDGQQTMLFIALFMLAIAPMVWLFLFGIRILFDKKKFSRTAFIASAIVSILGFLVIIYIGGSLARDFKNKAANNSTQTIEQVESKSYVLSIDNTVGRPINDIEEGFEWVIDDEVQYLSNLSFTIHKSDNSEMFVKTRTTAHGSSKKEAFKRAKNVTYGIAQQDSTLLFGNYFSMPYGEKFRNQNMEIILYIPVGTSVFIDEDLMEIIYDIPNITETLDFDMLNHNWLMTRNGLACLDCSAIEMEEDFEDLWDIQEDNDEIDDEYEDIEEKRKELERIERNLDKREKELKKREGKTSSSLPLEPVFLPVNSTINQEKNRIKGFRV